MMQTRELSGRACRMLAPEEGKQVSVDLILMRGCEVVRRARIVDFLRALDDPGRFLRRVLDGNDLVVLTVHDQGWNINLLEVPGEIGLGECLDALVGVLEAGLHAPEPELIQTPWHVHERATILVAGDALPAARASPSAESLSG